MICTSCGKEFKRRNNYNSHIHRKIPCIPNNQIEISQLDDLSITTDEKKEEDVENKVDKTEEILIQKIYNEDCVQGMKRLQNETADIIICDPPYNIGKDFGNRSDKQDLKTYLSWCDDWIAECIRVLKPTGTIYIYGFSEILSFIRVKLYERDINARWIVWHYTNKVTPHLNFWQRTHESILCCYKNKPVFNRDDIREPYTDAYVKCDGKTRKATKGRFSNGEKTTIYKAHEKGALPRDVIKIPALAGGAGKKERVDHPTQKPIELCDKLLRASRVDNTLLVVPFAGSGSECVAAKKLKINFIAYEINAEYVQLCNDRLDNE
jgi:site-specific DNA-methyltransferase (adenine-specific)